VHLLCGRTLHSALLFSRHHAPVRRPTPAAATVGGGGPARHGDHGAVQSDHRQLPLPGACVFCDDEKKTIAIRCAPPGAPLPHAVSHPHTHAHAHKQDLAKTNLAFVSEDEPAVAHQFLQVNGWCVSLLRVVLFFLVSALAARSLPDSSRK
jgi:hypothetical protein